MKFYKLTLTKAHPNAKLGYPGGMVKYQTEIGDFAVDHLYYKDNGEDRLLLCIEDQHSAGIVRNGVVELTEVEATAISEANEPRTEEVTDDAKIRRLTIKSNIGEALTPEELKAIDPSDPEPGIGMNKILADRIGEKKAIEVSKK